MMTGAERSPPRPRRPSFPLRVGGWVLLIVVPLAVWFLKGLEERPFTSVDLGAIQVRGRPLVLRALVGDLHRDGFVQKYDSDTGRWHLDR